MNTQNSNEFLNEMIIVTATKKTKIYNTYACTVELCVWSSTIVQISNEKLNKKVEKEMTRERERRSKI